MATFFSFVYILIDRVFIKVKLWPGSKKGKPVRINLSGLSRGYSDTSDGHNSEYEKI